ncbi:hypothetical protein KC360_g10 [Hortaea werneckii]|nr:hypothetical protein KC360_g10 [Hortaea werneckii]
MISFFSSSNPAIRLSSRLGSRRVVPRRAARCFRSCEVFHHQKVALDDEALIQSPEKEGFCLAAFGVEFQAPRHGFYKAFSNTTAPTQGQGRLDGFLLLIRFGRVSVTGLRSGMRVLASLFARMASEIRDLVQIIDAIQRQGNNRRRLVLPYYDIRVFKDMLRRIHFFGGRGCSAPFQEQQLARPRFIALAQCVSVGLLPTLVARLDLLCGADSSFRQRLQAETLVLVDSSLLCGIDLGMRDGVSLPLLLTRRPTPKRSPRRLSRGAISGEGCGWPLMSRLRLRSDEWRRRSCWAHVPFGSINEAWYFGMRRLRSIRSCQCTVVTNLFNSFEQTRAQRFGLGCEWLVFFTWRGMVCLLGGLISFLLLVICCIFRRTMCDCEVEMFHVLACHCLFFFSWRKPLSQAGPKSLGVFLVCNGFELRADVPRISVSWALSFFGDFGAINFISVPGKLPDICFRGEEVTLKVIEFFVPRNGFFVHVAESPVERDHFVISRTPVLLLELLKQLFMVLFRLLSNVSTLMESKRFTIESIRFDFPGHRRPWDNDIIDVNGISL